VSDEVAINIYSFFLSTTGFNYKNTSDKWFSLWIQDGDFDQWNKNKLTNTLHIDIPSIVLLVYQWK